MHEATGSWAGGDRSVPGLALVDRWLADREAQFADLKPGNAKQIVWADPNAPAQTDLALVYLHGFSASPGEIAPTCQRVASALGANLFLTRLTGHGRCSDAMSECDVDAWKADALEALQIGARIGKQVIVIGTSQGGTLSCWLAANQAGQETPLVGVVLITPNFGPNQASSRLLAWPGARIWVPWLIGRRRKEDAVSEGHAQFWTQHYPTTALVPMMKLVNEARACVEFIDVPVAAFYAARDQVVDSQRSRSELQKLLPGLLFLQEVSDSDDEGQHVISGDVFSPSNTEAMVQRITDAVNDHILGRQPKQAEAAVAPPDTENSL